MTQAQRRLLEADKVVIASHSCGGWIFVSTLGLGKADDKRAYREASKCAEQGYTVETLSFDQYRQRSSCKCGKKARVTFLDKEEG